MLLVSSLQQFDIELTDFLTILAALGLLVFLVPAVLSMPGLAVITESITPEKNKSFYNKCARQISQVPFGIGLMIFTILGIGASITTLQFHPEFLQPPLVWRSLAIMAPPCIALLLLAIYATTFNALKKQRGLHLVLGYLAALACLAVLCGGFILLGVFRQPIDAEYFWNDPFPGAGQLAADFFTSPALLLLAGYLFCIGVAAGTGLAQLWLIMRRHKEDFGRDYYNFAMRYCARFSLAFTLLGTGIAALIFWLLWQSVPPDFMQPQDRGVLLISFGLPLSCCLLWLCVMKSDTPLRHKPSAFFACLFLYLALCAQMLFCLSTFPML